MAPRTRYHLSKPVIGVTGNNKYWSPSWLCIRLSVFLAGGKAVRISINHSVDLGKVDALIISGGDDIHPSIYGMDAIPKANYDRKRDELEKAHIEYALENDLPLLGICRGMQLLNVVSGGDLFVDIRGMRKLTSNRPTLLPQKPVYISQGSRLETILNTPNLKVNSLHYQAINKLANHYIISATDRDNFVQGLEHRDGKPFGGVQWHPEYLFYSNKHRKIFVWLVNEAKIKSQT